MEVDVTILSVEKVNVAGAVPAGGKIPVVPPIWEYRCSFSLTDKASGATKHGDIIVSENTTTDQLWTALEGEANRFAAREHWFDDLKAQETITRTFTIG